HRAALDTEHPELRGSRRRAPLDSELGSAGAVDRQWAVDHQLSTGERDGVGHSETHGPSCSDGFAQRTRAAVSQGGYGGGEQLRRANGCNHQDKDEGASFHKNLVFPSTE